MDSDGYEYDAENDCYHNADGETFVENNYGNTTTLINVSNDVWRVNIDGYRNVFDWGRCSSLPKRVFDGLQRFGIHKLKVNSPKYIDKIRRVVLAVDAIWDEGKADFSDFVYSDHVAVWEELTPDTRTYYRELYGWLAKNKLCGAKKFMASELKEWKARSNVVVLKEVTNWSATTGAYTLGEWSRIKDVIQMPYTKLPVEEQAADALLLRSFFWIATLCGKRPLQLLGMKRDCIKRVGDEWLLKVRPVKNQTGRPYVDVVVTDSDLIRLLEKYCESPGVSELQKKHDRFFVSEKYDMNEYGELPTFFVLGKTKSWWKKNGFISDRTSKLITLTAYRIRHTVATNMAMNNIPRDIIAELLEHDSTESATAYINACATRLSLELNKVSLNNDNVFSAINDHYFNGVVVDEVDVSQGVYVPSYNPIPLLVGACGRDSLKQGVCDKHPFLSCYTCSSFCAWKDGEHEKALAYFDAEIEIQSNKSESWVVNRDLAKLREAREAVREVINGTV